MMTIVTPHSIVDESNLGNTIADDCNPGVPVPVIPLVEMDTDVPDTASVDTVSNRDDEVPGPQERRRLVIIGVESRIVDCPVGNQAEERLPQDASDGESVDNIGGHSDVLVENDPISTSQVPEPAVTNQMDRFSASFEGLASGSGFSVHTVTMPHEIFSRIHDEDVLCTRRCESPEGGGCS